MLCLQQVLPVICTAPLRESHAEYKCLTLSTKYYFCHNLINIRGDVCGVCCVWVFPPPQGGRFSLNRMAFHYALASECFSGRLKACIRSLKIAVLDKKKSSRGEHSKFEYKIGKDVLGYTVCLLPVISKHVI